VTENKFVSNYRDENVLVLCIMLMHIYIQYTMNGWLEFYGILSTKPAAILCLKKFTDKIDSVYKRDYLFRTNIMERFLRMDGWTGFNGILSTQVAATSCLKKFKVC